MKMVPLEALDHPVHLDHPEILDSPDLRVRREIPELTVWLETLVHPDHLDLMDSQVPQDLADLQE